MPKYYAVKNGKAVGIYTTWKDCKEQVDGYSGAEYKSFTKKSEAMEYLGLEPARKPKPRPPEPNTRVGTPAPEPYETACDAAFYVDGSYNISTGEYAFGAVMLKDGEMYAFSHKYDDTESASMRNVAGEIAGSLFAMRYAVKYGIKSVEIFYDYEGIEKWATGKWKANLEKTKEYVLLYRKLSEYVTVKFTKVKGHSGDCYNDMADRLAKDAVGIV